VKTVALFIKPQKAKDYNNKKVQSQRIGERSFRKNKVLKPHHYYLLGKAKKGGFVILWEDYKSCSTPLRMAQNRRDELRSFILRRVETISAVCIVITCHMKAGKRQGPE
jgi:hypothetical protein